MKVSTFSIALIAWLPNEKTEDLNGETEWCGKSFTTQIPIPSGWTKTHTFCPISPIKPLNYKIRPFSGIN